MSDPHEEVLHISIPLVASAIQIAILDLLYCYIYYIILCYSQTIFCARYAAQTSIKFCVIIKTIVPDRAHISI